MSPVLKPTTDLANRIANVYPSLSTGHRKAADFVLQNPLDSATMTIEGLAEKSGASTATVTRFVRALGYGGYGEFRGALSEALKLAMAPVASLADARSVAASPFATLVGALRDQAANLDAAISGLDEAVVSQAIAALLGARRIFVIGTGASHHVASFLEDGLALYLDADVIFAASRGGPARAIRHMLSAGPGDVVVAISMPRYSRTTLELCSFAKKRERDPAGADRRADLAAGAHRRPDPVRPGRQPPPAQFAERHLRARRCADHHDRPREAGCGRGAERPERKPALDLSTLEREIAMPAEVKISGRDASPSAAKPAR